MLVPIVPKVPIQINEGPLVVNREVVVDVGGVALNVPFAVHK